ncbi:MAG: death on curing protein [Thermoplasmata archaeon]|nr:death on curing protein [Thermoplasmata archaeon]
MHAFLLHRDGGEPGMLNLGLLDAALDRCRFGPFAQPPDLAARAAFLMRGICQDHPFVDGNKRTSVEALDTFLRENGMPLVWSRPEAVAFALSVALGMDIDGTTAWIRRRIPNLQTVERGDAP